MREKPRSYKGIVKVPDKLKRKLPTSFDIVGSIILIKLKDEIIKYKKDIGDALLKSNKNAKTVCRIHPVTGESRTRKIEIIAGEKNTKTIHKEYGLNYAIDVKKAYFSARLANERKRVADQVKKDEVIIDMFTGVAPFPIMIAKYTDPKIIYAFDKNKDAIIFARENIKINNVLDKIEPICDDASNISKHINKRGIKADRVIMNLPFSSFDFFPKALKILKNQGTIHYYTILQEGDLDKCIKGLKEVAGKHNFSIVKYDFRKIKSYSPREFYIGIDITAKRKKDADVA